MNDEDPGDDPEARVIRIGGQVDRTTATLRICGDDVHPAEITRLLGFPPTHARRKGEVWTGKRTGRKYAAPTGQWNLESPPGKGDLDEHVRWLLDAVNSDLAAWDSLRSRFEAELFCGLFLEEENRMTGLSAATMAELGKRGIALSLDIYAHTPEDD